MITDKQSFDMKLFRSQVDGAGRKVTAGRNNSEHCVSCSASLEEQHDEMRIREVLLFRVIACNLVQS